MRIASLFALAGFLVTFLTIPGLIRLARSGWGIDQPDAHRKIHTGKIARVGGLPLYIAFALMMVVAGTTAPDSQHDAFFAITLCGSLMFGLGFWDDLRPLGAKMKLLGQIAIACIGCWLGLRIDLLTYPVGNFSIDLGAWSFPLTVFWLIAIPNIVNLIDGFDGLAAGLGLFLSVTLGVVAWSSNQMGAAWVSLGMAGALAGFLFFNFPPAKIFLGDGGAYLIGFCVAAFSLETSNKGSIAAALMVTIMALGLPILDTSFALIRRAIRGVPLFQGDREHIHHRLEQLGFSKKRVVLGMYGVCVALNLVGLSIFWSRGRTLPIAAGFFFLLAVVAVRYLGYIGGFRSLQRQVQATLGRRQGMQYAVAQGQLMVLEVDQCSEGEEFWRRFNEAMNRAGLSVVGDHCVTLRAVSEAGEARLQLAGCGNTRAYWQRVADCFHAAFSLGHKKWPKKTKSAGV